MYEVYRENRCKTCPFKGTVSGPDYKGIPYIECLRDNEDAKKRFDHMLEGNKCSEHMLENQADLWQRQEVDLLHCIYEEESIIARMVVIVQR
jgi:hypothetical protein